MGGRVRPDHHRARPRLARAGRGPAHRARRDPHAGTSSRWPRRRRSRASLPRRGRRARLRHRPRQHVPPVPRPGPRAHRRLRRPARLHGLGRRRSSPTRAASRSSRWATARWPTRSRAARRAGPTAPAACSTIDEDGVRFRSYLDGVGAASCGPETSMEIQAALGSDLALVFDECTPFHVDRDYTARSTERTHRWLRPLPGLARRARPRAASSSTGSSRAACYEDLRVASAQAIAASEVDGIAIGGSLGADKPQMYEVVGWTTAVLDEDAPAPPARDRRDRRPDPRRRARHRHLRLRDADAPRAPRRWRSCPTRSGAGASTSRGARWRDSDEPIMDGCPCPACAAGLTRGYLRYLAKHRELTGHAAADAPQPRLRRAPHGRACARRSPAGRWPTRPRRCAPAPRPDRLAACCPR